MRPEPVVVQEDQPSLPMIVGGSVFALVGLVGMVMVIRAIIRQPSDHGMLVVLLFPLVFLASGLRVAFVRRQLEIDPAAGEVRGCWLFWKRRIVVRHFSLDTFNEVHVRSVLVGKGEIGETRVLYKIDLHSRTESSLHVKNVTTFKEAQTLAEQLAKPLDAAVTKRIKPEHRAYDPDSAD